jgi:hypothetical protein
MTSTNEQAMTAPGSQPVDKLRTGTMLVQSDPEVEVGPQMPPGTDGKPKVKAAGDWSPGAPSWTNAPSHSN